MDNLVSQGIELALFGMGTVFVFLVLLIFATRVMSLLVLRFAPEPSAISADTVAQAALSPDHGRVVAIISAAITQHRKNKK